MEEFALSCNYEHLVLDIGDKTWGEYFTDEELHELQTFQNKQFEEIPAEVDVYMDSLTQFIDPEDLRSNLKEELKCTSCEWVRWTILGFMKLFDCNYLPLNNQSEGDLLRRVWSFVDSVFDYSKINCIGGEKASKASSASKNKDRTISGKEKMENKVMGRKVDLLFNRQQLEYGCCECGRFEDQIKKFNDGCFKILKALKDMLYGLYKTSSSSVRDFMSIGNNPLGYVCRINRAIPLRLPEEKGDIIFQLLPILKAILQTKLTMEKMNDIIRKTSSTLRLDLITNEMLSPSFHYETNQKKRKRNNTNV